MLKLYICTIGLFFNTFCANPQSTEIGGPCEGCEAIYEYGNLELTSEVTLPDYDIGTDKIVLRGTVYKQDGKTPAENVILYVYQTNKKGKYPTKAGATGWETRHGYLRAWLKTDANGSYAFFTNRPASYPNSTVPQHIHITVKEPDKSEYYVEDFYFADDKHITTNIINRAKPRGGSGVISLKKNGKISEGNRDIYLGLHIPNYPE